MLNTSDIARIVKGKLTGGKSLSVTDIVIDSRQVSFTGGLAFVAIRGIHHDGHSFIENLYRKGIKVFIVERLPENRGAMADAAFILTENSLEALHLLASWKRKNFKSPVIAITGSAGKTIVKEWLADVLGLTIPVVRSPKSYNSQIGVPLSVWKLDDKYKLGIFEAGISFPGEMEKLQKIINPDIGVITNIGDAHSENFRDNKEKAAEKLKLFADASVIIYCSDQDLLDQMIRNSSTFINRKIIGWSCKKADAEIFVRKSLLRSGHTFVTLIYKGKDIELEIPFTDRASVENAITVASVCLALGTDVNVVRKGLSMLVSIAMRMELKSGINNCTLIEDYYNSDPGSLQMALEYQQSQNPKSRNKKKTTLILSDFLQSGRDEKELYGEVSALLKKTGIDKFIGIGKALSANKDLFDADSRFYLTTEEFIRNFSRSNFTDELILLKGARIYEFERIGELLEQQVHQTVLEINLDAISHNLNEFRRCLNPDTRIMAMVKAFAYGAGPAEIAALMEYHRVSYLGVAYVDEGIELRNAGVTLPVMVMSPDPSASEHMIRYNLEPEIYSFFSFDKFRQVAERHGLVHYPVHIKIDTGMHRLGFMPEEIEELAERIRTSESVKVASVFSHLAASEDKSFDSFTKKQVDVYLKAVSLIRHAAGYPFLKHILNSSGIIRFPQFQFDMVRPGIGIYGAAGLEGLTLRNAGRFKTRILQIKKVPADEPVGYGCKDVSGNERIIAILPVGYADGLNRTLGNRNGNLFIKGRRVPIIGNVCMDMCMADITGINAEPGDEAEIFGENISILEMAEKCGTIPYEILTSIPGRVKRIFFRE